MTGSGIRAFVDGDARGQRLLLSDECDRDAMQLSGRWLATTTPVEVRR